MKRFTNSELHHYNTPFMQYNRFSDRLNNRLYRVNGV